MKLSIYKTYSISQTSESYVMLSINNQVILKIVKQNTFCALWSKLAFLFPGKTNQKISSSCTYHCDQLEVELIDFKDGLRIEDIPKLESKDNFDYWCI